jgi:hypothetical protein
MPDEMKQRRFPRPRDIEEINKAAFVVRDNNGTALAYVYFEDEPGRRAAASLLTRDEARRIAANIARLPDLLSAEPRPTRMRLFTGGSEAALMSNLPEKKDQGRQQGRSHALRRQ